MTYNLQNALVVFIFNKLLYENQELEQGIETRMVE